MSASALIVAAITLILSLTGKHVLRLVPMYEPGEGGDDDGEGGSAIADPEDVAVLSASNSAHHSETSDNSVVRSADGKAGESATTQLLAAT